MIITKTPLRPVSNTAPTPTKGKDYYQSASLQIRVMLTAAAQNFGHYNLWKQLSSEFQISLDTNLVCHLKSKDFRKGKRQ